MIFWRIIKKENGFYAWAEIVISEPSFYRQNDSTIRCLGMSTHYFNSHSVFLTAPQSRPGIIKIPSSTDLRYEKMKRLPSTDIGYEKNLSGPNAMSWTLAGTKTTVLEFG